MGQAGRNTATSGGRRPGAHLPQRHSTLGGSVAVIQSKMRITRIVVRVIQSLLEGGAGSGVLEQMRKRGQRFVADTAIGGVVASAGRCRASCFQPCFGHRRQHRRLAGCTTFRMRGHCHQHRVRGGMCRNISQSRDRRHQHHCHGQHPCQSVALERNKGAVDLGERAEQGAEPGSESSPDAMDGYPNENYLHYQYPQGLVATLPRRRSSNQSRSSRVQTPPCSSFTGNFGTAV